MLWVLIVNGIHAQATRALEVQRAVVNEDAFFWLTLSDFESDAENVFFRLAGADVARAEKDEKFFAQMESFDAVFVEFERLVVDSTDEIFLSLRQGTENSAGAGIFLGLGEHEGGELFASEGASAVEERAVEIFVERDEAGVEGREGEVVAVFEFFPVNVESAGAFTARVAVPTVGEDDSADVPEKCGDFRQVQSPVVAGFR